MSESANVGREGFGGETAEVSVPPPETHIWQIREKFHQIPLDITAHEILQIFSYYLTAVKVPQNIFDALPPRIQVLFEPLVSPST